MARERVIAAIDVGTTKVCTLVGSYGPDREAQIVGVGVTAARGIRKGMVVNIDEAVEAVHASVEKAERSSGFKIVSALVGLTGSHVSSQNSHNVVAISRPDRLITEEEVNRATEAARTLSLPSNREIVHVIPRSFTLDGQDSIENPIGMHGYKLDVDVHIITASSTAILNLTKAVQRLGIEVEDLVLEPIASSEAVLGDEEREMGVVLVDIGGGTTDIAVHVEGSIYHTASLAVGGYQVTNDIAIMLSTPLAAAEQLKIKYGHALPNSVDPNATVDVSSFGSGGPRSVSQRQVCEVIRDRLAEILEMALAEIKNSGYTGLLPAGIVLTGGTANLPGIEVLAQDLLRVPVRVGPPLPMLGLTEVVDSPAYATAVGLLRWGFRDFAPEESMNHHHRPMDGLSGRFLGWLRDLLPH